MTWILIHGFLGRPESWDPIVRRLPPSARVIRPTLFGHGPLPVTSGKIAFDDEVTRIAGLVERERSQHSHLVGYSMGARVALRLLLKRPDLFDSATLVGVHAGIEDDAERATRAQEDEDLAKQVEREGLEHFVANWETRSIFESQRDLPVHVIEEQRAIRQSHLTDGIAASLRSLGRGVMPNTWPDLQKIRLPVELVVGEKDAKFREIAGRMAAKLEAATISIMPGTGHNPVLEAPERVAEVLLRRK